MQELTGKLSNYMKSRAGVNKMFSDLEGKESIPEQAVEFFGQEEEILLAVVL